MMSNETIAAVATAPGRGAVAIVRMSGDDAFAVAGRLVRRRISAGDAGRFFHAVVRDSSGQPLDDVLLLVFKGPRSYTGEDAIELQCHGGSVAPRRILEACLAAGARLARRGEFTQRAFLNGRLDLGQAEAVIDLVDARTDRAADYARSRLDGASAAAFSSLYDSALDLSVRAEHALDFDEDELPSDFCQRLHADAKALAARLAAHISTAREGRMLREGADVVLAGAPNSGKSSLMNALLGASRAIVSPAAGTTRDTIEESFDIHGWPVRLTDTAGLRAAAEAVEAEGVSRAAARIGEADLVLLLAPCNDQPGTTPAEAAALSDAKCLRVASKSDLAQADCSVPGLRVSAKTGDGIDTLKREIASRLAAMSAHSSEETGADVTTREKEFLMEAAAAIDQSVASLAIDDAIGGDLALAANGFRRAAESLGLMTGKIWSEDVLSALFDRFCVGK